MRVEVKINREFNNEQSIEEQSLAVRAPDLKLIQLQKGRSLILTCIHQKA